MTNLLSIIAQSDEGGGSIFSFLLLPLMLVGMYFLIIRPNSKRRKQAAALQSELSVGDEVLTAAGIVGTITGEDGPTRFWLEIDDDVQVRIARGSVQGKIDTSAEDVEPTDEVDDADEDIDSKNSVDGD
ncbi:preprotein translocase subunit YajC [Ilumatobacter nonamiensis]|uniref:preprotein translocase subunit YajC n=1 Tax=Ilumatobacter nonamiensis TaxID=467093 RepID=UPI0003455A8E|nr:preprotein translocase subunit YajC [Ilumatobacter nonamiensis]